VASKLYPKVTDSFKMQLLPHLKKIKNIKLFILLSSIFSTSSLHRACIKALLKQLDPAHLEVIEYSGKSGDLNS